MRSVLNCMVAFLLFVTFSGRSSAQQASPFGATSMKVDSTDLSQLPTSTGSSEEFNKVLDRVVERERFFMAQMRHLHPLVETYIQSLKSDHDRDVVPVSDDYFLGRLDMSNGTDDRSFMGQPDFGKRLLNRLTSTYSMKFQALGFAEMVMLDEDFQKKFYDFTFVDREFLGEVRCLVFDVTPLPKSGKGRFLGRIWVEDQDYHIVRFNGAYSGNGHSSWYFHFDSWRTNVQPGLWLPTFVYSEEKDLHYAISKKLDFKAQTRLWGYNLGSSTKEEELSKILIEAPVSDDTKTANDLSPIQAQRSWDRQAEDNVTDRLERIGLMAPKGEVDKVLETVVNNLEVTNNIDVDPEVRCRVLMVSTLESFTVGHTIVLSRGLIDVLPDEASLATMLSHELSHVVLGHRVDSQYAFFDQLLVDDKDTFRHFGFARTPDEEAQANAKAIQILNNSPYKNQLGNAGLFLQALESRQKEIPNLISGHLGNRVPNMTDLKSTVPVDPKQNPQKIAALPLGGRVKIDPWNDNLSLIKSKPIGTVAEREKMPFEVTPFMPYLTRYGSEGGKPVAASATSPADAKPGEPPDPTKP
jgi:hypothetical protein